MNRFLWPLLLLVVLVVLLAVGLNLNPREVPSPLVGKLAPAFALPRLDDPSRHFSPQEMRGRVWLLNLWATWCSACRQEHPLLVELARSGTVTLVGLNYKEIRGDGAYDLDRISPADEQSLARRRAVAWLNQHGDPYAVAALDLDGRVGIDFGVYGVPETYVIDRAGVIRLKHVGPLTRAVIADRILPLVAQLNP